MEAMLFPAAVAVAAFIGFLLLLPERISSEGDRHKKAVLGQMSYETEQSNLQRQADVSVLKELRPQSASGILAKLPGMRSTYDLILKAGLWKQRNMFILAILLLFVSLDLLLRSLGLIGLVISLFFAFYIPRRYLKRRIWKRNDQFLNLFPDTVDMIVRSVRSGHPLNTAMRMIAENMDNPVREEFKQVVDEVSYGRSLPEALKRLSERIGEQDLHFFVVVLSVQQETGGNLAEVLTNLSTIIRRRRQLRLKIRALTSEGRATSYVLGSLPVVVFLALFYTTPEYLNPLFARCPDCVLNLSAGNYLLGAAIALIITALVIVRAMVNIEI